MDALRKWFAKLSESERRVVSIGGAAAVLIVVLAGLLPFEHRVSAARQRVATKQSDLLWLQGLGPQLSMLNRMAPPVSGTESLPTVADREARRNGISHSTSTLTQNGAASVHFEQAPFDALATWANDVVQRDGLHIESATIESTSTPGTVNATIVLRRG